MTTRLAIALLLSMLVTSSYGTSEKTSPEQRQQIREKIEPYLSIKRPYPFPEKYATAPEQCRLVHINHIG